MSIVKTQIKLKNTLMTEIEKQEILTAIREAIKTHGYADSRLLARRFQRLPLTIRDLISEVKAEGMPPVHTELTYESMWAILGCMLAGMLAKDICVLHSCTVDDIKQVGRDHGVSWFECVNVRKRLVSTFGEIEWQPQALKNARWQPASPVVPSP